MSSLLYDRLYFILVQVKMQVQYAIADDRMLINQSLIFIFLQLPDKGFSLINGYISSSTTLR
jgi:hypothetical protein